MTAEAQALETSLPTHVGRYQILCELGQGGMGTIYLGRAEGIGGFERLMAIKMIHSHLSKQQSFIDMFLDEARIAALIRHPNVVPVYEIGEFEGRHYIAMDYVSGEPLSVLLDNTWCVGRSLDFDLVAYVVSVVCEALHAAHELNDPQGRPLHVVHRDVCPQNVMLGYDGIVRVMDFGVAKAVDQLSQTRPGSHKGKVPYMAPEQIRCQRVDRRSDVFSLGVVLWESTIGRRLFKAPNDILSAARVLKGKVPKPTRARDGFPQTLEEIVLKALHPKPDRRYQTAREMGQALRKYLAERSSVTAPSDVETLLKEACGRRYRQRMELEQRISSESLVAARVEDHTQELRVAEMNLPAFDEKAALETTERDGLLSAAGHREVYEFGDENSDNTVRTELEELGFLATAEYQLLEEDPSLTEAAPTTLTPAIRSSNTVDTPLIEPSEDSIDLEPEPRSYAGRVAAVALLLVALLGLGWFMTADDGGDARAVPAEATVVQAPPDPQQPVKTPAAVETETVDGTTPVDKPKIDEPKVEKKAEARPPPAGVVPEPPVERVTKRAVPEVAPAPKKVQRRVKRSTARKKVRADRDEAENTVRAPDPAPPKVKKKKKKARLLVGADDL